MHRGLASSEVQSVRRNTLSKKKYELIGTVINAVLVFLGVIFLCLLFFSAISSKLDLSDEALYALSGTALSAGCFSAAYIAGKRRRHKGILIGLVCGGIVFLLILLLGIIFVRSFSSGGIVAKMLIIIVCSVAGGIVGVNSPRRFR